MPKTGRNDFYSTTSVPQHKPSFCGYKAGDVNEQNWGSDSVRDYLEKTYGNKLKHVERQPMLPSLGDERRRVQAKRQQKSDKP